MPDRPDDGNVPDRAPLYESDGLSREFGVVRLIAECERCGTRVSANLHEDVIGGRTYSTRTNTHNNQVLAAFAGTSWGRGQAFLPNSRCCC